VITVIFWITDRWHGLPSAVVALFPVFVLSAAGIFARDDLGRLEWNILILIAGGISLGSGMQMTGMDRLVVQSLATFQMSPMLLLGVLVFATILIGTFMSNTAVANLFLPIGISASTVGGAAEGLSPIQVALSIAFAASFSMALPVSTPSNAIAYARGQFGTRDMARVGILLGGLGAVLIIFGGGIVFRIWGLIK
jgi:sodium-dependent dicarboxylate transporter 2/3/5